MSFALRVENLWKSYAAGVRGCSARVWVLRGVWFSVEWGERVAVVGAPRSGKTTLLQCIAGMRRPDAGVVEASAALHLLTRSEWERQPRGWPSPLLVVGEDTRSLRGRVDRVFLLRDGRLTALGPPAAAQRVAESSRQPR